MQASHRSPAVLCRILAVCLAWHGFAAHGEPLAISDAQALSAGKRLWKNECAGTVSGLTSWNAGEDFASLGIGHYIWYPTGRQGPFEESFPELLRYLKVEAVALPEWLASVPPCPWTSREEFLREQGSPRMKQLRDLLGGTVARQARFSVNRLQTALPKMLADVPGGQRDRVRQQFDRVAASPNGVYALVDYVNFKGEGTLASERYQGQGWGLLQVLAGMPGEDAAPGPTATREFAASAARVLTQRVANAPDARHESQWLPGWKSRVQTYAP